jgi:hypothetical protein
MAAEGYAGAPLPGAFDASGAPLLARRLFYLGDAARPDAGAVGLVNVAVFLSQALADSVAAGSCDEVNRDAAGDGLLARSNACGQFGLSYQDMRCGDAERHRECEPRGGMDARAEPNGRPGTPFYCGPTSKYPFTGTAEYGAGGAEEEGPASNRNGRTDVEG